MQLYTGKLKDVDTLSKPVGIVNIGLEVQSLHTS